MIVLTRFLLLLLLLLFSFTRKCKAVLPGGPKKVAVITRSSYSPGGRKAGFHCIFMLSKRQAGF